MPEPLVVAYRPEWVDLFRREALAVEGVLGGLLAGPIEHIGSTAIPGMMAKPQIDMMAPVRVLPTAQEAAALLRSLGYVHQPHRRDAVLFVKRATTRSDLDGLVASHSLPLTTCESDLWEERPLSRDSLRRDGGLRSQYAALKRSMLSRDAPYSSAEKRDFVREVLALSGRGLRDDLKVDGLPARSQGRPASGVARPKSAGGHLMPCSG